MTQARPLFTIEHALDISATPEEVWSVLADFERYAEWNPYVLALSGDLTAGSQLAVTILQSNWPKPIVVTPTLLRAEPNRVLHWQGRVGEAGLLDTDHIFQIDVKDSGQTHFIQREEFSGSLAESMDEAARTFTHEAFQSMNEALAERVETRGGMDA